MVQIGLIRLIVSGSDATVLSVGQALWLYFYILYKEPRSTPMEMLSKSVEHEREIAMEFIHYPFLEDQTIPEPVSTVRTLFQRDPGSGTERVQNLDLIHWVVEYILMVFAFANEEREPEPDWNDSPKLIRIESGLVNDYWHRDCL